MLYRFCCSSYHWANMRIFLSKKQQKIMFALFMCQNRNGKKKLLHFHLIADTKAFRASARKTRTIRVQNRMWNTTSVSLHVADTSMKLIFHFHFYFSCEFKFNFNKNAFHSYSLKENLSLFLLCSLNANLFYHTFR